MLLIQSTTDIFGTVPLTLVAIVFSPFSNYVPTLAHEQIVVFFTQYTVVLAVGMLLLMSTERFLAINFPFQHRLYVTTTKIFLVVVFLFLFLSIPAFVFVIYILPLYFISQISSYNIYFITIGSIIFVLIVIIYILLVISYATIKISINTKIKQQEERTSIPMEQNANIILLERKSLRIFRILLAMCTIYMVTFVPLAVLNIYYGLVISPLCTLTTDILDSSFGLLYHSSSIINPLVTLMFKEDYRKTFYIWFKRNTLAPAQNDLRAQHHTQDIEATAL